MALIKKSVFGPGLYFFFTLFSRGSIRMGALVFGCGVLITWGSNRKNTVWTILRGFFHKVFYSTTFFPQNSNFRQISATFEGKWLNFDKNSISFDQNSRIFFRNSSFFSLKINLTPCILAKTFHKGRLCTTVSTAQEEQVILPGSTEEILARSNIGGLENARAVNLLCGSADQRAA